jgi:hypothetical protein
LSNPKSLSWQAACIRHALVGIDDQIIREGLEGAIESLEKVQAAMPAMKAVLEIYNVFPGAALVPSNHYAESGDL